MIFAHPLRSTSEFAQLYKRHRFRNRALRSSVTIPKPTHALSLSNCDKFLKICLRGYANRIKSDRKIGRTQIRNRKRITIDSAALNGRPVCNRQRDVRTGQQRILVADGNREHYLNIPVRRCRELPLKCGAAATAIEPLPARLLVSHFKPRPGCRRNDRIERALGTARRKQCECIACRIWRTGKVDNASVPPNVTALSPMI